MWAIVLIWVIAIVASLVALGNKEPLDRLRVYSLWGGGFALWVLTREWCSATQIAAGVLLADAVMSFVLINVVVALRIARGIKEQA